MLSGKSVSMHSVRSMGRWGKVKVDGNSRGVFISHDGITLFFNSDYTIKVTKRDGNGVTDQWHTVGEMKADAESFAKLAGLINAV